MITPVLYTALKTKDVFTDDARHRTLDSTRNQFKVFADGIETFSLSSGNSYAYTKTITHNLGYVPLALCWAYYTEPNEAFDEMLLIQKYTLLPYVVLFGTDPLYASLVGSIERTTTYVKFKFFQQTDLTEYDTYYNYAVTNMKMRYIVYIDQE